MSYTVTYKDGLGMNKIETIHAWEDWEAVVQLVNWINNDSNVRCPTLYDISGNILYPNC